jgi:hypothetical protein
VADEIAKPTAAEQPALVTPPASGEVVLQPGVTGEGKTAQISQAMPEPGAAPEAPQWVKEAGFESFDAYKEAFDKGEIDPATGKRKAAPSEGDKPKEGDAPKDGDKPADDADPLKDEAKVAEVKAKLKEAGGIFADPRYEQAALEFELKGDVSEATLKATAEAFSVPLEVAQQYIDGQKAQRQLLATQGQQAVSEGARTLHAVVGGEAEYGKFQTWAAQNLPAADQEAYDKALSNNDVGTASALLKGFHEAYKAAGNGSGPRDITSEGSPSGPRGAATAEPFASQAQMMEAMNDKRYASDPAYRKTVENRIAVSDF